MRPPDAAQCYDLNGAAIEHDEEGYLVDVAAWTPELALQIATTECLVMDDERWDVVRALRSYYEIYQVAPPIRILVKVLAKTLGPAKGNSDYLYRLFPEGPAKQACKIAGLPKPTGCV